MRIKRLELNGFKSFKDRVNLDLGVGVTGIVGPNGCGKSNIVDAIRWVIGEQSPKHLRGDAMEDVIFAGNSDNGPLGMAEVSLLLERDEADLLRDATEGAEEGGGLPPVFAGVSEVLVTRRYFRSGESEYFINRAPCRLKDITELFLGTGVGTKAYAIIEQGRIEQLVNAKPQEMRLFIEEAAGVTRFRHRKTAALRKMERTRDNLLRVQDVLSELDRQRASLERQARRAEEHQRIKGELRELDLRVLATRRLGVLAEIDALQGQLGELAQQEETLQAELRRLQAELGEDREQRLEAERRARELDAALTEQRVAAGEAHVQASAHESRAAEMVARSLARRDESGRLRERLQLQHADTARLAEDETRAAEEQDAAAVANAEAAATLDGLAAAGPPLERAVEEAKDAVVAIAAEEARLRNTLDALRARREEVVNRRQRLEEEQRTLGARLHANAEAEATARDGLQAAHATLQQLSEARRAAGERLQTLAGREAAEVVAHDAGRTALTQLESRMQSLRELQLRYEGCTRGVASLLGRSETETVLLASVLRVPADLERAVAAALGAKLSQVVVPGSVDAAAAIGWLAETQGGSATALPRDPERRPTVIVPSGRRLLDAIEVAPGYWSLAEAMLGNVLVADDVTQGLEIWRAAAHAVTVVTPAGEAIDPLGAISGGSEPPLEETLLARARELRELEEATATERARVAELLARLEATRRESAEAAADGARLDGELQQARMTLLTLEKDRERLEEERARITAQLEVSALDASGLAGTDEQIAGELATQGARLEAIAAETVTRRSDLAVQQEALAGWRERHVDAERGRTAAAVREAAAVERRRAVSAELARSRSAIGELEQRIEVVDREAVEAEATAAVAAAARATAQEQAAACEVAVAALGCERTEVGERIAALDASMSEEDLAERAGRERLDGLRDERGRHELAAAERRLTIDHIGEQLAERYELTLDALLEVPYLDPEEHERGAARVEQLRRRLVQLGDVNPAAVAELEEVRTRFDFLETQRTDLEASLEDLRRTISRLTRLSRERFDETFVAANEKLADMFPKLFPGGKARLELVPLEDGEDGEPGIQIVVQPAGKKLQHLSLLSGGEKAMTATALVLSLFLIRPTPFCLLDEVDAPLDEANIGRFIGVVREMAETSQFMLITHNRRTMEMADTLYGITMEQAGVSKVVSVRLREAA